MLFVNVFVAQRCAAAVAARASRLCDRQSLSGVVDGHFHAVDGRSPAFERRRRGRRLPGAGRLGEGDWGGSEGPLRWKGAEAEEEGSRMHAMLIIWIMVGPRHVYYVYYVDRGQLFFIGWTDCL